MRIVFLLAVLGTLYSPSSPASAQAQQRASPEAAHEIAPEFSLPDLGGKRIDLAAYRGKVVLVDFWATWCAPCRTTIPRLVELQKRYRERGLRIIGISLDDDPKPVHAAYKQFAMNYPVVIGNAALAERYGGILGLPVMFVIRCDGRIERRLDGETELSVIEHEVETLLHGSACKSSAQRR